MSYIGFHYLNHAVHYCVLENKRAHLEMVALSYIPIPRRLSLPDQLSMTSSHIQSTVMEYQVQSAYLKLTQPSLDIDPLSYYIEGVILSTMSNSQLLAYEGGFDEQVATRLRKSPRYVTQFLANTLSMYRDALAHLPQEHLAAIIAAEAAYYLLEGHEHE